MMAELPVEADDLRQRLFGYGVGMPGILVRHKSFEPATHGVHGNTAHGAESCGGVLA
jgi:hypothetical protein